MESDAIEMKEPLWERNLFAGLKALGREETEFQTSKKSAAWKVALAPHLRERFLDF